MMFVRMNTWSNMICSTLLNSLRIIFQTKGQGKTATRPPSTPTSSFKLEWDESRAEQKQSANTLSSDTDGEGEWRGGLHGEPGRYTSLFPTKSHRLHCRVSEITEHKLPVFLETMSKTAFNKWKYQPLFKSNKRAFWISRKVPL